MLHAALVRSPHPHARVKRIDFTRALEAPGVRAAVGPDDVKALSREAGYFGAAVAAICADTMQQARAALALVDAEWEVLEAVLDPEEAARRAQFIGEPKRTSR